MGTLFSIGSTLVSSSELAEKMAIGGLRSFREATATRSEASIEFSSGSVRVADVLADTVPFEPVAPNKPMTIELQAAYTGNAPKRSWFDRAVGRSKPDLLIVSGAKDAKSFSAAPRAVNQIVKDVEDQQSYRPSAFNEGSPIIYHSPALVDNLVYVSVELVADSFSGEVFEQLAPLLGAAAGLPIFAPAAVYLAAGAQIVKMGKKLAEALTETPPFLRGNENITVNVPGYPVELARFMLFHDDAHETELKGFTPKVIDRAGSTRVVLIDKQSGAPYSGQAPFVIASLHGGERTDLKDFQPQHASAALLDRFYGKRNIVQTVGGVVQKSLMLYNDFEFRRDAERLKSEMSSYEEGSEEQKKAKARLAAYLKNIQTKELRAGL